MASTFSTTTRKSTTTCSPSRAPCASSKGDVSRAEPFNPPPDGNRRFVGRKASIHGTVMYSSAARPRGGEGSPSDDIEAALCTAMRMRAKLPAEWYAKAEEVTDVLDHHWHTQDIPVCDEVCEEMIQTRQAAVDKWLTEQTNQMPGELRDAMDVRGSTLRIETGCSQEDVDRIASIRADPARAHIIKSAEADPETEADLHHVDMCSGLHKVLYLQGGEVMNTYVTAARHEMLEAARRGKEGEPVGGELDRDTTMERRKGCSASAAASRHDTHTHRQHQQQAASSSGMEEDTDDQHFQVLGVSRDADLATITAAYRHLALLRHPDKPGGTT
ncbi:unnamed protein product [Vitrella brassicaformis CCMP3155]|uniref:J domain-containing protein n=1 Tax=Vitrella brassicaformis (strain CCMP3155) TaxID=1169540 RepID=A0A0G4FVH9_VITBC|nr:unnamed protein product [Vitrella brassicaformis CCMP3155]|eukprot:CEM18712.1 unnamed protein product [Vitrella brassicaformis CCMP3155]